MRTLYSTLKILLVIAMIMASYLPAIIFAETSDDKKTKTLDASFAKALMLYYEKDYDRALSIFKDISNQFETSDLMFLVGRCEARTGNPEASVEKFQMILSKSPDLHTVRLALADSFIMMGNYKKARTELEKIKTAPALPQSILDEVDKRYARISVPEKFNWRLSLYAGGEYDDNINSGPDRTDLPREQRETSSYNFITGLNFHGLYDVGESGDLLWNGTMDAYYSVSEEDSDYNYLSLDLSTGPLWQYARGLVRMPIGYIDTSYGEEHLTRAFYIRPNVEHFFTEQVSIQGTYELTIEDYVDSDYTDYDNTMNEVTIGANLYLNDMRHIFSGAIGIANRDADADHTSFDALSILLSYYTKFPTNTELLLRYKWREREYDGPSGNSTGDRDDDRHTFNATVGQTFYERYFASFGFTYMDNDSNDTLFDFDKTVYTLKIGCVFK